MATGPEHYQAAEKLLAQVKTLSSKNEAGRQLILLEALVHAGLAQAAANAPMVSEKAAMGWNRAVR